MCASVRVYERARVGLYTAAGDVYTSVCDAGNLRRGWVYVKFKARRQLWRNLVYYEIVEVVRWTAAGPFWPARAPPPLSSSRRAAVPSGWLLGIPVYTAATLIIRVHFNVNKLLNPPWYTHPPHLISWCHLQFNLGHCRT